MDRFIENTKIIFEIASTITVGKIVPNQIVKNKLSLSHSIVRKALIAVESTLNDMILYQTTLSSPLVTMAELTARKIWGGTLSR
jgi:hypothetical protein